MYVIGQGCAVLYTLCRMLLCVIGANKNELQFTLNKFVVMFNSSIGYE
jgi:hypothetical protein